MIRKSSTDSFSTKTSRNDRFAQMSRQEQVIEQKKREIQARLQQQQKEKASAATTASTAKPTSSGDVKKQAKPTWKGTSSTGNKQNQTTENSKTGLQFNIFSNDGSFLDQFKQLSDTRKTTEQKSLSSSTRSEKGRDTHSDDRNKPSRWSKPRSSYPSNELISSPASSSNAPVSKTKPSRFSDPPPERVQPQQQPQPTSTVAASYTSTYPANNEAIFTAVGFGVRASRGPLLVAPPPPLPPLAMPVPPPVTQVTPQTGALIAPPPPPPTQSLLPGISVPPPLGSLSIPPPASLQLRNIPSPSPIRLNEIPDPKPIDLLNIPAPGDDQPSVVKAVMGEQPQLNQSQLAQPQLSTDPPDFIKSVPPPNKSVPPPALADVTVPPPGARLPAVTVPPPASQPQLMGLPAAAQPSLIPPLMAQPVLPPPGALATSLPGTLTVPPLTLVSVAPLPGPPPVLSQPPPMNYPPPPQQTLQTPPGVDVTAGSAGHDAMVSLSRMVAQCGSGIEDIVHQRSTAQDPSLWFLFHKHSAAYQQYRQMVEMFRAEQHQQAAHQGLNPSTTREYQPEDIYEPDNLSDDEQEQQMRARRKRKSRWGDRAETETSSATAPTGATPAQAQSLMLSKITRNDPGLISYAMATLGTTDLSEDEWRRAEDHYKVSLLYREMERKRRELERLQQAGRNKYEYDSDEDIDGGTWEHKLRTREMESTQTWADELTRQAEGKHHIGDFLPPDELNKFLDRCAAARDGRPPAEDLDSDYQEHRLRDDNVGFQMLQKLGWREGQGLGSTGTGIVEPVNKASAVRDQNQGLGLQPPDGVGRSDDEYDAYRKRMMLAYRFRPNPLNNPRRPYY